MNEYGEIKDDYDKGWFDCLEDCVKPLEQDIEQLKTIIENLKANLRVYGWKEEST